ncbi:FHA domain-containing protein [Knoellia flava]|uniref:FHA domain-containing protein n=2 Tax=Knoellia flava TaxID=913969 RepID=A0A8H9KRY1_9MICO|nr:FHA domain-containing protein [Knoellia flava]GGB90455.1 hypothetical protein GCM10011314_32890 [Knoellia flava]
MSSTEVTTRTPAGWVSLSAGERHLLVQGSAAFADDLRGPLGAGVAEVLEALSRDGLRALPDFALVDSSGEQARVVVRGAAVVRADGDDVTAEARMPWRDLDVAASALELAGPGGRGGWKKPRRLGRPVVAAAAPEAAAGPEAAVDPEPAAEPEPTPESDVAPEQEPTPEPEPAPAPTLEAEPDGQPDARSVSEPELVPDPEPQAPPVPPADLTLPPSEEYAGAAPAERVVPEPAPQPEKKVLIDSVPWRTLPEGDRSSEPAAAQPAPPADVPAPPPPGQQVPDAADGPTGPDNWGLTGPSPMAAGPAAPASDPRPEPPSEPVPPPGQPAASAPPAPDVTMDRSALGPAVDGPADSPIVLAVICPAGHHSSPHASSCRVCGRDIPTQQPFQTPRPQLGVLRVSTGGLVPLDRGVLLGRSPKVNADLPPSSRPHLVRLASRDNDISRNHAEVILEGWHVLVRDLGSTNGTTVTLPGQEPVRLRPTEDFGIEPGAVLTLADEVSLTYEVSE